MSRPSVRFTVALFCIVFVLLATASVGSASDLSHFSAILPLLPLLFGTITVVLVRRGALPCDEHQAALLSLALFRAPPAR